MKHRILALPALLAWVSALLACKGQDMTAQTQSSDPAAIKIGFLASPSRWEREVAARLALGEINAAGGIHGKPLEFLVAEDACTTTTALEGTRYLLDQGAVAILGPICSSQAIAVVQQVCLPAGVPMVSFSGTAADLTTVLGPSGLFFRTAPSDAFQGRILARQVWATGLKTTGVLFEASAYGRGLAEVFREAYERLGGKVTAYVSFTAGKTIGFTQEVNALFAPGVPDAVLLASFDIQSANITRDIKLRNPQPTPKYFASDSNRKDAFLANAEPSVIEGLQGTVPAAPASDPNFQRFSSAYTSTTRDGLKPNTYGENSYDAVYLVAYAIAAGGATPEAIKANLRAVSRPDGPTPKVINVNEWKKGLEALKAGLDLDYQGASGKIDLDGNGDPTSGSYAWWRIRNGKFETLEIISYP